MEDIFVGRLMSSPVHSVSPDATLSEAATEMLEQGIGSLVVVDADHHLEGILTATDFVKLAADGTDANGTTVGDCMSTDVVTTTADAHIRDVGDLMMEHGFHHVPVLEDDEGVIGMVTTTDLAAYLSHIETPSPS